MLPFSVRRLATLAMLVGIATLVLTSSARANLELTLADNNGHSMTVGPTANGNGVINSFGSLGIFNINFIGGIGFPALGSGGAPPEIDLFSLNVASTGGGGPGSRITITFTETTSDPGQWTGLNGTPVIATYTFGGTIQNGSVSSQGFADNSNAIPATQFATTALTGSSASSTPVFFGGTSSLTAPLQSKDASHPGFSLSEQLVLTVTAANFAYSGDGALTVAAPEPAPIALALTGLPVLCLLWARRRRPQA